MWNDVLCNYSKFLFISVVTGDPFERIFENYFSALILYLITMSKYRSFTYIQFISYNLINFSID